MKWWHPSRDLKNERIDDTDTFGGKKIPERRQSVQRPWGGHALACKVNGKELGVAGADSGWNGDMVRNLALT